MILIAVLAKQHGEGQSCSLTSACRLTSNDPLKLPCWVNNLDCSGDVKTR